MYPRKVGHIDEVLDVASGAGLPVRRIMEVRVERFVLQLGELGDRATRRVEADPDEPVTFRCPITRNASLLRYGTVRRDRRDAHTDTFTVIRPPVVGADDIRPLERTERKRCPAMDAEIVESSDASVCAKQNYLLIQEGFS